MIYFDYVVRKYHLLLIKIVTTTAMSMHTHISWYTNTHRGQPLAIYHAAEPGKPGHLVDGTKIPAGSGKDIPVLKGVQRAV